MSSSTRTPRRTLAGSPLVRSSVSNRRLAGRASDSFLAQCSANDDPQQGIPHSPSTPYHQFAAAQRNRLYHNEFPSASSPFRTAADNSALSQDEHGSNTSSPAYRKGAVQGFVSGVKPRASVAPRMLTVRKAGGAARAQGDANGHGQDNDAQEQGQQAGPSPKRQRYIRSIPMTQKLKQMPMDIINTLYLRYMVDFSPSQLIYETSPTLPIAVGATMHVLSLLVCVVLNPGSQPSSLVGNTVKGAGSVAAAAAAAAGAGTGVKPGAGTGRLFQKGGRGAGSSGGSRAQAALAGHVPETAIADLRSFARGRQADWMRMGSILFTLALLLAAIGVAYKLFTNTRRYTFWMRNETDRLRSSRAKLVPLSLDEDVEPPSLQERAKAWAMRKLREVPILGWFLGPEEVPLSAGETRMYSLDMWNPPTMLLRLFCIYSPLHAFLWALSSPLFPSTSNAASVSLLSRFFALVLWPALHVAITAQLYFIVHQFQTHVQDRTLIQSEAMREYDEKFVFPNAMPMMRDASTMTNEAETFDYAREMKGRGRATLPASLTRAHQSVPSSLHASHTAAGRSRGTGVGLDEAENEAGDSSFGSDFSNASPSARRRVTQNHDRQQPAWQPSRLRTAVLEQEGDDEEEQDGDDDEEIGRDVEDRPEEEEDDDDADGSGEEGDESVLQQRSKGNVFQGRQSTVTRRR